MKTATIPSLRVAPALRDAAENVLEEGETLSGFVEQSLRAGIRRRELQHEFLARGLAARAQAQAADEYYSADAVLSDLDEMLEQAEVRIQT